MDPKQETEALRRLVIDNGYSNLDALAQVRAEQRAAAVAARLNADRGQNQTQKPQEGK